MQAALRENHPDKPPAPKGYTTPIMAVQSDDDDEAEDDDQPGAGAEDGLDGTADAYWLDTELTNAIEILMDIQDSTSETMYEEKWHIMPMARGLKPAGPSGRLS